MTEKIFSKDDVNMINDADFARKQTGMALVLDTLFQTFRKKKRGYLQFWLNATDEETALVVKSITGKNDFELTFFVKSSHPVLQLKALQNGKKLVTNLKILSDILLIVEQALVDLNNEADVIDSISERYVRTSVSTASTPNRNLTLIKPFADLGRNIVPLYKNSRKPIFSYSIANEISTYYDNGYNFGVFNQQSIISISISKETATLLINDTDIPNKTGQSVSQLFTQLLASTLVIESPHHDLDLVFKRPNYANKFNQKTTRSGVKINMAQKDYVVIPPSKINNQPYTYLSNGGLTINELNPELALVLFEPATTGRIGE